MFNRNSIITPKLMIIA
uniref:Uncharacterized protein n=1 Tax=Rhizophora mucronata TaxID=61149 RepID=A0A2P2QKH7_RHIMU